MPEPDFPVYGLDGSFQGPRSVDVWNRADHHEQGPLWYVSLSHGTLDGPHVVVITDAKLPPSSLDPDTLSFRGATGLTDAALLALLGMTSTTMAGQRRTPPGGAAEGRDLWQVAKNIGGPDWSSEVCHVDGRPTDLSVRRIADSWAAAVDIGPVAIGLHGRGLQIADLALVPVNEMLAQYQAS